MRARLLTIACAVWLPSVLGVPLDVRASTDTGPPVSQQVIPDTVTATGQPIRLTVIGSDLADVTVVDVIPSVQMASVQVVNDRTVVVTLQGMVRAGMYAIVLSSPLGSSQPQGAIVQVMAGAPAEAMPTPSDALADPPGAPTPSLLPAPLAVDATRAPAAAAPLVVSHRSAAPVATAHVSDTRLPYIALASAISSSVVAVVIMMGVRRRRRWTRPPRRLLARITTGALTALHLAHRCTHCSRLHSRRRTPRDLWRLGQHCSVTCYVAAQEEEYAINAGQEVGAARLVRAIAQAGTDAGGVGSLAVAPSTRSGATE